MPRYRLTVEYDGRGYAGWQRQENGPSIQGALEEAIFRLSGERVNVTGAGRTDAGVHARGQVAHFDISRQYPAETIRDALNAHVRPQAIAVLDAALAAPDFHARFSAMARIYEYRILCRRAPPALDAGHVWHVSRRLDSAAMQAGARFLIGQHDFTSFRAAECQAKSPVKTLDTFDIRAEDNEIRCETRARSFLHHQVRSMVGTLKLVGEGKYPPEQVARILAARDRSTCGPVAPAEGLTLMRVEYPPGGG
jgi:tRNA pseudouridine38-40 synthase